ncbi:hypothetical protein CSA56_06755 [candidate division KSB3 bacterium]|uniref:histidine kinase n=1 Tax=candidate division KSB3 bacterium TaxID=2044937 RepID=A0A2G6KGM4_9BACT|nr:MAG: hypothetical protein CSA56_06755 [candidate division KSB3 bacterium]
MVKDRKIRTKFSIALLAVGLVPFLFIGIVALLISSQALSKQAFGQLESLREVKKTQLKRYFAARQREMGALIETVATLKQAAFDKLATAQEIKKAQVETYLIQHLKNITVLSKTTTVIDALKRFRVAFGSDEEGKVGGELYTFLDTLFGESFQQFMAEYGYDDLYLIAKDGTIVYSVGKQADEGENLLTGSLRHTSLSAGFQQGLHKVTFQDFAPYPVPDHQYCAFLVAPISDQIGKDASDFIISGSKHPTPASALSKHDLGEAFGALALKISPAMLNTIVQRREGMGETGETYIVGLHDGIMQLRSDRIVQDGRIGQESVINGREAVLSGQAGQDIQPGNDGALEVRSYAPLNLPGLSWFMISSMSLEEAINPRFDGKVDYFTRYNFQYGYEDLLLIHPEGEVFYTVVHHPDYQTNILTGEYKSSNLGVLVRRVLDTQQFALADVALYAPDNHQPAAFIAQPVVHNGMVEVVVALKLSIDSINEIMLERSGIGATGETYLVGSDLLMRSNTFRDPEHHSVLASFREPGTGKVATDATRSALSGETGARIINGYAGKRVLSSYTPVHVGDTVWALIAEIDEDEAFAATHALKYAMGIVAIVGVGVVLVLALVLSHVMVKPLSYLATIADRLAGGDIACDLDKLRRYVSHDEVGTLARSFEKFILYIQDTAAIATRIAQGNLSHTIRPRSKRDVLGQAFLNMSAYLESMATAATVIATGDFTYHIQPKTDEDVLGNAFTKMTVQLRDNFDRIQQEAAERQQAQKNLAEERNLLWTLIDHLPDWIYVKDTQGHFMIANTTIAQFVGVASPNDLIGKRSRDVFPAEITEKFSADDRAVIESGQGLRNREEQIVNHATGETSWILTTKVPFRDQHGEIVGLVGIDRDITERIQMEQRVREAERMAAIGRITASLSHEIRNPLSAIKMNLQLLKRNYQLVESARVHIDISVEEMIRLEGILSEVLDFAKPLYPTFSECDINGTVESCLQLLRAKFDQKHLEVHRSFDKTIPSVRADTKKLSQAVINLALNAFEASEEGGQLWIASRYHPAVEPPEIEVIVEDEGVGLNQEQLHDLFKPFFTTKAHGTGLGLTNARRIIETHSGRIEVKNRSPRGASFHMYLPVG